MTPRNGQPDFTQGLAFKSVEIEELADVYFFRPAGGLIARAAQAIGISPVGLTLVGALIGIIGGGLFYNESLALVAFGLLILHGIVDSADGQLARLTGKVSEFGRALDGLSGYATHTSAYFAMAAGLVHRGGPRSGFIWMLLAGLATAVHAGMYEYHRYTYMNVVGNGRVPNHAPAKVPPPLGWFYGLYLSVQRVLTGPHAAVETTLAARSLDGGVRDDDRALYRKYFCPVIRGWNFLGDNTRFFAIGVFAGLHRADLYFCFVLVAMNAAFCLLWFWQRRADREFLGSN